MMTKEEYINEVISLIMKDCRVMYFGMAIAHGGKLPSFYEMRWKDFALNGRVKRLGISPEEKLEDTLRFLKSRSDKYADYKRGEVG